MRPSEKLGTGGILKPIRTVWATASSSAASISRRSWCRMATMFPAPTDPFHDPKRIPDATQNFAINPIQIYHLGLWFNNPQDVVKAGGPPNVTPFNGEHDAGVQVLNTGEFAPTDGPLKRVTTSG